jgi:hypothetical protein
VASLLSKMMESTERFRDLFFVFFPTNPLFFYFFDTNSSINKKGSQNTKRGVRSFFDVPEVISKDHFI